MKKQYELETEVDGIPHKGYRVISSNKAGKFQVVYLSPDVHERDQTAYTAFNESMMEAMAKDILRSLVTRK